MSDDFDSAVERVKRLKQTPAIGELLELYAFYKQGTVGDCQGKRPGMLDFRGRAKFDAWAEVKGLPREDARQRYVDLVLQLEKRQGE